MYGVERANHLVFFNNQQIGPEGLDSLPDEPFRDLPDGRKQLAA